MEFIERKEYLQQLDSWRDKNVIKVITGIRRCGKSVLMQMYAQHLLTTGIQPKQIITLNFEDLANENLLDYHKLYEYLDERIYKKKKTYIFLDEIQLVQDFQKVVDSLQLRSNVDIYITGSNAYLLSGELATLLSGRYVEIKLLPLSFKEFAQVHKDEGLTPSQIFLKYLQIGGFPYLVKDRFDDDGLETYLEGIYNTIILKDIEEREGRRQLKGMRKVSDLTLLKNIAKFLAGSIGSLISVQSITNYIVSSGRKISPNTVNDYLHSLVEPYVFYPVERFNIVGKELMKSNLKYYIVDLGLQHYLLPRKDYDLGFRLENVVYFELLRRGYRVYVGKVGNLEIDFVAQKDGVYQYFQVSASLLNEETFKRELAPLQTVKDNYPKTVLTLDEFTEGDYDGVKVINVLKWLLV